MAVKRISYGSSIPVMKEPKEFFSIGEIFGYTPMSDQSVYMVLEPVENNVPDCTGCVVRDYCCCGKNAKDGLFFVPDCHSRTRKDGKEVIFKKV